MLVVGEGVVPLTVDDSVLPLTVGEVYVHPIQKKLIEDEDFKLYPNMSYNLQRLNMRAIVWKEESLYWKQKYEALKAEKGEG